MSETLRQTEIGERLDGSGKVEGSSEVANGLQRLRY